MAAFRYAPLESVHVIRLLAVKPSLSRGAPIVCHLKTFNLSSLPRYEALSYTWDGQVPLQPIQCNGSELLVTANVEAVMKQLRRRFSQRFLWIDAICIDQNNIKERGLQVSLMNQVFLNASNVLVWLGVGDKITARAVKILKWIFPVYKLALYLPFTRYFSLRKFRQLQVSLQNVLLHDHQAATLHNVQTLEDTSDNSLRGLRRIVHHDWFRRIWTIQEISMAKSATVIIGHSKIRWTALTNILTFDGVWSTPAISTPVLMEGGYDPTTPIYNGSPFMYRVQQIQIFREWLRRARVDQTWPTKPLPILDQPPLSFTYNLILTGLNPDYKVTDPRDRVFGLHGLLRACGIQLPAPDYGKDLPEIVLDSITTIGEKYKSLEFLRFVTGENSFSELPSWVPDFCVAPWSPIDTIMYYKPDDKCVTDFKIQGRRMTVSGVVIGKVALLTEPILSKENHHCNHPYSALNLPSDVFLAEIRNWIHFVRKSLASQETTQESQTTLLFKLLLHPQILPFYEDIRLMDFRGMCSPFARHRLLQHFSTWLNRLESHDPILMSKSDHVFDQVQHFISSEKIIASSMDANGEHALGYQSALLVIQRWVREHTARKRMFTTDRGLVGIGWQAMRTGDSIVKVAGLSSLLVLRKKAHDCEGHDEMYQVIGPCMIPEDRKVYFVGKDVDERRVFVLV